MAFFAVTSMAPILLIVVAIAGLAFGEAAAQNAIVDELTSLVGRQSAEVLQGAIKSASDKKSGLLASVIGAVTFLVSASGVFGEMQSALNAIWKVKPTGMTFWSFMRARAASLGLVAALGFLLMVSLVASAGITALSTMIDTWLPFGAFTLSALNGVMSFLLISILFAAIFNVLPDLALEWHDVLVGAVVSAGAVHRRQISDWDLISGAPPSLRPMGPPGRCSWFYSGCIIPRKFFCSEPS